MEYPITGSCQCGQVSFELKNAPKAVFACHCTECQKLSTAPFSVTAFISADDIAFFGEMKEWSRLSDSGNTNVGKFCPNCGNRVYHFNPDDKSSVKLKLKPVTKEHALLFKPTAHVWVSEKLEWVDIPDSMKTFEKGPI